MKIEIEYAAGEIHVLLTKDGNKSHFKAKASEQKATVIFAALMKNAAELFNQVED